MSSARSMLGLSILLIPASIFCSHPGPAQEEEQQVPISEMESIESTIYQLQERLMLMERNLEKHEDTNAVLIKEISDLKQEKRRQELLLVSKVFAALEIMPPELDINTLNRSLQVAENMEKPPIMNVAPFVIRDSLKFKIAWFCDARYLSQLMIADEQEFKAQGVRFTVERIGWSPGSGSSIGSDQITDYCPSDAQQNNQYFSEASPYQVIPQIDSTYFVGCELAYIVSDAPAVIRFTVNDNNYTDNDGGYMVKLNGWW